MPHQDPIRRHPRRHRIHPPNPLQHMRDPPRTPPRMLTTQLTHRRLHLGRSLMRTRRRPTRPVRQPRQTRDGIPGLPPAYRLTGHPRDAATSVTVAPTSTAKTARYLCSTTDNSTRANPGLPTRTATTRAEKPTRPVSTISWDRSVKHLPGPDTSTSSSVGSQVMPDVFVPGDA